MSLERIDVLVTEEVECFRDKWDYSSETHYTDEWLEEMENVYHIFVEMDDEGNILEPNEQLERKVLDVIEGTLISFKLL